MSLMRNRLLLECDGCPSWNEFYGCVNYCECEEAQEIINDNAADESHDDYPEEYFNYGEDE